MPYKDKEKALVAHRKYLKSEKGRAALKKGYVKYAQTEKGKEAKRAAQRRYQQSEKGKKQKKDWYKTDKGKVANANHHLKSNYGLTLADKQVIYNQQNGLCKLCGRPLGKMRLMSLDHCHKTGKIRGIVHTMCNTFIGIIEKYPDLPDQAKDYLAKAGTV